MKVGHIETTFRERILFLVNTKYQHSVSIKKEDIPWIEQKLRDGGDDFLDQTFDEIFDIIIERE